jgi:hypothetical protein
LLTLFDQLIGRLAVFRLQSGLFDELRREAEVRPAIDFGASQSYKYFWFEAFYFDPLYTVLMSCAAASMTIARS